MQQLRCWLLRTGMKEFPRSLFLNLRVHVYTSREAGLAFCTWCCYASDHSYSKTWCFSWSLLAKKTTKSPRQPTTNTLNQARVINWVGGLGRSVNLGAHHNTRPAWWCVRSMSHTLNPNPPPPPVLYKEPVNTSSEASTPKPKA